MASLTPAEVTFKARRLYIGNMPEGTSEESFVEFFNEKVQELKITTNHPIMDVYWSKIGAARFAFVEFRGVQDAKKCESLMKKGLTFKGRPLREGWPADFREPPKHLQDYIVPLKSNTARKISLKK